jgi:hypothetical protein
VILVRTTIFNHLISNLNFIYLHIKTEQAKPPRVCQQKSIYSKQLKTFQSKLLKISNNVYSTSYIKMREMRKKFIKVCESKVNFTKNDRDIKNAINATLEKLKISHPELFNKKSYKESDSFKNSSQPMEITVDQIESGNCDMSKNIFTDFVAPDSSVIQLLPRLLPKPKIKKATKRKQKKQIKETFVLSPSTDFSPDISLTPADMRETDTQEEETPVAAVDIETPANEPLPDDDIKKKLLQNRVWADELLDELKKLRK